MALNNYLQARNQHGVVRWHDRSEGPQNNPRWNTTLYSKFNDARHCSLLGSSPSPSSQSKTLSTPEAPVRRSRKLVIALPGLPTKRSTMAVRRSRRCSALSFGGVPPHERAMGIAVCGLQAWAASVLALQAMFLGFCCLL